MSEAGFNQAYFEHRVACEPSSSTAPELSVCILLISWEGLCPCQDTVPWWVPRSALKWRGSGPGHGVTLLGVAHRQNRHLHRAQGMWEQVTLCNSLREAVQAWMSCSELQLFKHKSAPSFASGTTYTQSGMCVTWELKGQEEISLVVKAYRERQKMQNERSHCCRLLAMPKKKH